MSNNKILDTALSIIDKNIYLDYKAIARKIYGEIGYNDQDFNKFFAVATSGKFTLQSYIRKRRLFFAACDLANGSEKTIVDLSLECGYSEQSSFTRAIKKEYGMTPDEIRRNKQSIPDVREQLELNFANNSRLDSVFTKLESGDASNTDFHYFEEFIHATDELGFDTSTCCMLSELSEKLSIPFGYLIEKFFEMTIEYDQVEAYQLDDITDCMMELGIESDEELDELCEHYNCKWYELTFIQVKVYQLGAKSEKELERIWDYYHCKWSLGDPYPLTKQMVQEYHEKHK